MKHTDVKTRTLYNLYCFQYNHIIHSDLTIHTFYVQCTELKISTDFTFFKRTFVKRKIRVYLLHIIPIVLWNIHRDPNSTWLTSGSRPSDRVPVVLA